MMRRMLGVVGCVALFKGVALALFRFFS